MRKKTRKVNIIIPLFIIFTVLFGGYAVYHFNNEIEVYKRSAALTEVFFQTYTPQTFINNAADAEPYQSADQHEDALYIYEAPEGFTIISYSPAWNNEMLELLRWELMLNEHGDEINFLYEIIVYPYAEEDERAAATYTLSTKALSIFFQFPAFPPDFTVDFPQDIGSITLYNGDRNTTIESMASSLSHEYGHLYTHYYMFDVRDSETDSVAESMYASLREASRYDLLSSISRDDLYWQERHRYMIETAAEDYVQLMGSPTTRQTADFVDVRQIVNGEEQPDNITNARNAFPQENMKIPLANDVPGLNEYFYSFINAEPQIPVEQKKDINLQIRRNSVQHELVSGLRTFVHYEITWNTPYSDAIYTISCYDPDDYTGFGFPVKTVHPGQSASAVIGEYVVSRGDQVVSANNDIAQGTKVFFVVALLPDGTFYISGKLEHTF